jgi:hypothetical protein
MYDWAVTRALLIAYNHVLPLPLFAYLWWDLSGWTAWGWILPAYLLGIPLVLGYSFPIVGGLGAGLWRFRSRMAPGGMFPHHGFIYASTLCGGWWCIHSLLPVTPTGTQRLVASLLMGTASGFVGWIHDTLAVREGMIELRTRSRLAGAGPHEAVFEYGPATFFLLGALYAAECLSAESLASLGPPVQPFLLFLGGLALLWVGSASVFSWQNRHAVANLIPSRPTTREGAS